MTLGTCSSSKQGMWTNFCHIVVGQGGGAKYLGLINHVRVATNRMAYYCYRDMRCLVTDNEI